MMKKLTLLPLLMLCILANATTYYFSNAGSDAAGNGSIASPYATLPKLNALYSSNTIHTGDVIAFRRGDVFTGSILATISGTAANIINFISYGTGANPVISGFSTVTGWNLIDAGKGIYESTNALGSASTMNMVTINGQTYAMGRTPNANAGNGGYLTYDGQPTSTVITDVGTPFDNTYAGATIVVRTSHGSLERASISTISGNNITFNTGNTGNDWNTGYTMRPDYGYFVQNSIKCLDQFGEWYYNPSTHKLSVCFGAGGSPTGYTVQGATVDKLFQPQCNYMTITGVDFKGANYCIYQDWGGMKDITMKHCIVSFAGQDGICLQGRKNFTFDSGRVEWCNNKGINMQFADTNTVITHDTIQNCATFSGMLVPDAAPSLYAMGIYVQNSATIQYNRLLNTGGLPINFFGNNILVANNYIDTYGYVIDDVGGIYSFGGISNPTQTNRQVSNNVVVNGIGAAFGADGIKQIHGWYADDNCNGVTLLNNTFANCGYSGMFLHNAHDLVIKYNLCYNNEFAQLYTQHGSNSPIFNITFVGNQLFSLKNTQLTAYHGSVNNDFSSMGTFDSNQYCNPFKALPDSQLIMVEKYNSGAFTKTFNLTGSNGWRATYGFDINTKGTPISVASADDVLFRFTADQVLPVRFCSLTYQTLANISFKNKTTVNPYKGLVLLRKIILP